MLTFSTALIFIAMIIVNYKNKTSVTIDLSLMFPAMVGDIILACIIF